MPAAEKPPLPPLPPMLCARMPAEWSPLTVYVPASPSPVWVTRPVLTAAVLVTVTPPAWLPSPPLPPTAALSAMGLSFEEKDSARPKPPSPPPPPMLCARTPTEESPRVTMDPRVLTFTVSEKPPLPPAPPMATLTAAPSPRAAERVPAKPPLPPPPPRLWAATPLALIPTVLMVPKLSTLTAAE